MSSTLKCDPQCNSPAGSGRSKPGHGRSVPGWEDRSIGSTFGGRSLLPICGRSQPPGLLLLWRPATTTIVQYHRPVLRWPRSRPIGVQSASSLTGPRRSCSRPMAYPARARPASNAGGARGKSLVRYRPQCRRSRPRGDTLCEIPVSRTTHSRWAPARRLQPVSRRFRSMTRLHRSRARCRAVGCNRVAVRAAAKYAMTKEPARQPLEASSELLSVFACVPE